MSYGSYKDEENTALITVSLTVWSQRWISKHNYINTVLQQLHLNNVIQYFEMIQKNREKVPKSY